MHNFALYETFNCVTTLTTGLLGASPLRVREINEVDASYAFADVRNADNVLLIGGDLGIFHYLWEYYMEEQNISSMKLLDMRRDKNLEESQYNHFVVIQPALPSDMYYHSCRIVMQMYRTPQERSDYWLNIPFRYFELKMPKPPKTE